jgi:hypothetical protein
VPFSRRSNLSLAPSPAQATDGLMDGADSFLNEGGLAEHPAEHGSFPS